MFQLQSSSCGHHPTHAHAQPALPCHAAEPGCHLRISVPFSSITGLRHRPSAAGGAEPGRAAPPPPAATPAGMLGPAGGERRGGARGLGDGWGSLGGRESCFARLWGGGGGSGSSKLPGEGEGARRASGAHGARPGATGGSARCLARAGGRSRPREPRQGQSPSLFFS